MQGDSRRLRAEGSSPQAAGQARCSRADPLSSAIPSRTLPSFLACCCFIVVSHHPITISTPSLGKNPNAGAFILPYPISTPALLLLPPSSSSSISNISPASKSSPVLTLSASSSSSSSSSSASAEGVERKAESERRDWEGYSRGEVRAEMLIECEPRRPEEGGETAAGLWAIWPG